MFQGEQGLRVHEGKGREGFLKAWSQRESHTACTPTLTYLTAVVLKDAEERVGMYG